MATVTLTKTPRTLVAVGTVNAAGGVTRGGVDLRTAQGGWLTLKIANGATGPTATCVCTILTAHNAGATPSLASAGADWKTAWSFSGGTANSTVTEQSWIVPMGVMHLAVEFSGNTGQSVTVEALFSEITSATDV